MGGQIETATTLKEILKEMNRRKSNCSSNSSVYARLMVRCFWLLFDMAMLVHCIYATNSCSQSMHETTGMSMRYPKSPTPSPIVAIFFEVLVCYLVPVWDLERKGEKMGSLKHVLVIWGLRRGSVGFVGAGGDEVH